MCKRTFPVFLLVLGLGLGCASPPTIALLTDFGWDDPYAAAVQGVILTVNPKARLLSLSHAVPDYNIREASYLLATSAKEFPKGTIFLAVVDPEGGGSRRPLIVESLDGKYFVGPDNGIFTDVIRSLGMKRAVEISNVLWFRTAAVSYLFHGRDVYGPAAARLSLGKKLEDAGAVVANPVLFERAPALITDLGITGEILHRDHYGNLVTNIPATVLAKSGWRAGMDLEFVVNRNAVRAKFAERLAAVGKGEFVLVLNGQGLLELARYLASAGDSLSASAGDSIVVRTAGAATPPPAAAPTSRVAGTVSPRTR